MDAKSRFAAYIRVSKLGDRNLEDLRSHTDQRAAIAAFAAREGFEVEWGDDHINVSGADAERQALEAMIARIESGELAGLVVYKLDRLSRLPARQRAELFERIENVGGKVVSTREDLDPSTSEGRFARDVFLGVARMQWEQARDGFAHATETAISNGCHTHAPFGYRKPVREDGEVDKGAPLAVVEREASVVRGLFRERARGTSWSELVRWAERQGVAPRRGEHWTRRSVETIVHNPAYLGEARYGDHRKADAHPVIVTLDEFEAANVARGVRPPRGEAALLSGLVRCAGCRHRMRANTVGRRSQRVYGCRRFHGGGKCPAPASVNLDLLNEAIELAFLKRYGEVQVAVADTGLAEASKDLVAAERALETYLAAIDIDDVGEQAFRAGARARRQRVDDARDALHRARSQAGGVNLGPEGVEVWPELTIGERRRLLTAGIDCVFVRRVEVRGRNAGLDPSRIRAFWRGEAPDDLPGPGIRSAELRSLDW